MKVAATAPRDERSASQSCKAEQSLPRPFAERKHTAYHAER
jgi:hypothetical protein